MVKIDLILPDGRSVPAKIKDKHYKRLTVSVSRLSFWERLKLLIWKTK